MGFGFCLLLQLIYNKFDEVGIVVFGTEGLFLSSLIMPLMLHFELVI